MKKALSVVVLSFIAAFIPQVQAADRAEDLLITEGVDVDLNEFLWIKRPIVVFADSPLDPRFVEQMEFLLADTAALAIRDVVVLTDTDPSAQSNLRKTLRPRGFMLVLIDKDGGVKLRKPLPWDTREIGRSIDKWPTRQQEIRQDLGKE